MRYLVTGGAGFVGSHLVDALVVRGDRVLVLDDLSTGRLENLEQVLHSDLVEFVEGSVLDADLVDDCTRMVDGCVHLAAAVGVRLIVNEPLETLQRNVRGIDNVLSAAARHGRKLLFASTSEVYGKNEAETLHEDSDRVLGSPLKSRWAYATSKVFGEALAQGFDQQRGAPMVVARLFSVVGPRQTGAYGMVLPRFVRQALAGEPLTVFGNGTQSRCFAHVLDACHALLLLLDHDEAAGKVFNVGSSKEIPIVELARRVIERAGSESAIRLIPYSQAYGDGFEELWRRSPDSSALERLTGWAPARTIDEAIDDVIAHERSTGEAGRALRLAG